MQHLKNPINISSGLAERVRIALKEWFTVIAAPDGDGVVITANHQFAFGLNGFLDVSTAPQKNQLSAKTIGELLGNKFSFELNVVVPGSYAELHSFAKQILNKAVIVLIEDDCSNGIVYQLGCDCTSAWITHVFETGTEREGFKGYTLTISSTGSLVQLYGGRIKIFENVYPDNGFPFFLTDEAIENTSLLKMAAAYSSASTYTLSTIFTLVASRGSKALQLCFRNSDGEHFSSMVTTINTSSISAFIADLQTYLDALLPNKLLTVYGSKLLVKDDTGTEQYYGFALLDEVAIQTEDGIDIITEDGETLIVE